MKTMPVAVKALLTVAVVIALVATGYWMGTKNLARRYWIRTKKSEPIADLPSCHPSLGDLAPDGNMFVALTPDRRAVTVSPSSTSKKPWVIKLARPARDIVAIGNKTALISYGTTGEVALLNVEGGQPEKTFKVGSFAGEMCKSASSHSPRASQAFISDAVSGKIFQFDLASKSVIHTYSVKGKPAHMKWLVRNEKLEVFGEKGKSLGTLNVTAKSHG